MLYLGILLTCVGAVWGCSCLNRLLTLEGMSGSYPFSADPRNADSASPADRRLAMFRDGFLRPRVRTEWLFGTPVWARENADALMLLGGFRTGTGMMVAGMFWLIGMAIHAAD